MATRYNDKFRRDAVRIATTRGPTRPQAASDVGEGSNGKILNGNYTPTRVTSG
jgi:hypothetical protein